MELLETTRFSQSISALLEVSRRDDTAGRLIRIYPAEGAGQVLELAEGRAFVGRSDDCDIHLDDNTVSRRHATIERFEKDYAVTDLNSTNGTFVNEERIDSRWLAPGDRVRFGNQIFKFLSADQIEAQYHDAVYKIITTDGLTQVYNKRYFLDVLEREVQRAVRNAAPLCVLIFDVDRFKQVNDTHGHLTGDEVLCDLCRRAKTLLRSEEVLARYGGEEFALILADTPLIAAREAAERLRQAIAEAPIRTESGPISVTVSIGIAELHGDKPIKVQQLLEQADRRLYMAKESGRNRVMG